MRDSGRLRRCRHIAISIVKLLVTAKTRMTESVPISTEASFSSRSELDDSTVTLVMLDMKGFLVLVNEFSTCSLPLNGAWIHKREWI